MDLFQTLGIKVTEEVKPMKQLKQRASKKTSGSPESYDLPITIYDGYGKVLSLTASALNKQTATESDILDFSSSQLGADINLLVLYKLSPTDWMAVYRASSFNKDRFTLPDGARLNICGSEFSLESSSAEEWDSSRLNEAVHSHCPVVSKSKFAYSANNNTIIAVPDMPGLRNEDLISFPIRCFNFGRGKIEISKDDYIKFADSNEDDVVEDDDDERTQVETGLTVNGLSNYLAHHYMDMPKVLQSLQYFEGIVLITVRPLAEPLKTSDSVPFVIYPTANVSIKFGWASIPLAPELFGGKEEVTKEELCDFLMTDYPEYSEERTQFVYDDSLHIIIPILTGGRKGARLTLDEEEAAKMINSHVATPFILRKKDGTNFHVMNNEIGLFAYQEDAAHPSCAFRLRLPKMPSSMIRDVTEFFSYVYEELGTEAMVHILYDECGYEVLVPNQRVTGSSTIWDSDRPYGRKILVAEMHSHGAYPAFWSQTDDMDEMGYRIYGVFGSFAQTHPETLFRAGMGGRFIPLDAEEIIDPQGKQAVVNLRQCIKNIHVVH